MQLNTTMSDEIYHKIKEKISNRSIKSGEKINQNNLALELNTSRTPVVKALYRLASEGILENIPNKGFYVHELTLSELRDLFYLRQTLDQLIVKNIIQRNHAEAIAEYEQRFAELIDGRWDSQAILRYWELDKQFHNRLIRLCDNQWVHKIESSFQIYDRVYKEGLLREPSETLSEHVEIIQAIRSRNEVRAVEAMHEHTQKTIDYVEEKIEQLQSLGFDPDEEHIHRIIKDKITKF